MARSALINVVALLLAFGAGWQVKEWQRDSLDLVMERAASKAGDKVASEAKAIARQSARDLEGQLEALRNAPPKEIRTELVKPVFTHVCLSDEFVSMYNSATEKAERTLSGKRVN